MRPLSLISVLAALIGCCTIATAESKSAASLGDQLKDHFHPARVEAIGHDSAPPSAASAVRIQLPGILSVSDDQVAYLDVCPSVYRAGEIRIAEGSFCATFASQNKRTLEVQDRAYVTAIRVNATSGRILFSMVSCETCEAGKPLVLYRSLLVFDFPRGYLENTPADEVIRTIERTLTAEQPPSPPAAEPAKQPAGAAKPKTENGKSQSSPAATTPATTTSSTMSPAPAAAKPQTTAPTPSPATPAKQPPATPAAPTADKHEPAATGPAAASSSAPATPRSRAAAVLKKGQTPDQVVAILGKPDEIVELGSKLIYSYRNLKVVFVSGKLSDIE